MAFYRELLMFFPVWRSVYIEVTVLMGCFFLLISGWISFSSFSLSQSVFRVLHFGYNFVLPLFVFDIWYAIKLFLLSFSGSLCVFVCWSVCLCLCVRMSLCVYSWYAIEFFYLFCFRCFSRSYIENKEIYTFIWRHLHTCMHLSLSLSLSLPLSLSIYLSNPVCLSVSDSVSTLTLIFSLSLSPSLSLYIYIYNCTNLGLENRFANSHNTFSFHIFRKISVPQILKTDVSCFRVYFLFIFINPEMCAHLYMS